MLAGRPAPEPHGLAAYEAIRRQYLRVVLASAVVVALLGAFNAATPSLAVGLRAGLVLVSLAGLLHLRRGGDVARLGQVVATALTLGVLALALVRLPERWPLVLAHLPPVLVFSMLVAGPRLAVGLAASSVAVVCGALLLPSMPTPAYLAPQLYGLFGSLLLTTFYFLRFAIIVGEGAADLAASVAALEHARRDSAELAQRLSQRVSRAVDELARAVRLSPARAQDAADVATLVLAQSRKGIPPEPELPELSLGEHLEALRLRAMDLGIAVLLVFDVVGLARMAVMGPRENLPLGAAGLSSVVLAALVRWRRPAWRRPVTLAMWLAGFGFSIPFVWSWYARAPIPPPPLVPQLTIALFLGALYSPRLAWACLALALGVNLTALTLHVGIVPADVVGVVLAYAVVTWVVWSWPRELLEVLRLQRLAAAESIRERRRLVATLFHDLANPMGVVSGTLELAALGRASPDAQAQVDGMVARMQASLTAALSGRVSVIDIEAGPLCDDVERLFHERLQRKQVTLEVSGPRDARLRGDVALLRDSVLANLVSNALKFSPEGAAISLAVERRPGQVALLVEDRGPGLPADVAAAVARGRTAPSRPGSAGEAGSGYGLMLVRDYVAAMGGQLELAPRPGGGLRASVVLPAA